MSKICKYEFQINQKKWLYPKIKYFIIFRHVTEMGTVIVLLIKGCDQIQNYATFSIFLIGLVAVGYDI